MANVLNISSSSEPVVDTSGSAIAGQTYSETAIDKNTGSSGGLYKSLTILFIYNNYLTTCLVLR